VRTPVALAADAHAYNLYTVRLPKRDAVREALVQAQIGHSLCYPQGLHLQDVYKHLGYQSGSLPVTEQASTEVLSLPVYPGMPAEHVARVCEVVCGVTG
jgi:dTDP-4-amino-4,6-dideoxygalactose transaminase